MSETGTEQPNVTPVSQATSLDAIRQKAKEAEEGKLINLPSGITLKLKRPSLSRMLRDKMIPNNLVGAAIRMTTNRNAVSPTDLAENIALMEHVLSVAIIEPEGMTKDDIAYLSDEDKGVCFLYIQEGASDLDSFRKKQLQQATRSDMPQVSEPKAE